MPTFDVVSQVDWQEVRNAVDQANREISNRYDFKGTDARVDQSDDNLTVYADDEYKVEQAAEILHTRLAKRGVDLGCLAAGEVQPTAGGKAKQELRVRHGIDQDLARKLVRLIKGTKLKVQASIQGPQIRVSGKKRDDLQQAIAALRAAELDLPVQFVNFRD